MLTPSWMDAHRPEFPVYLGAVYLRARGLGVFVSRSLPTFQSLPFQSLPFQCWDYRLMLLSSAFFLWMVGI